MYIEVLHKEIWSAFWGSAAFGKRCWKTNRFG